MMISAKRIEGRVFQVHFEGCSFFENPYQRKLTAWMHGKIEKHSFDYDLSTTTVTIHMKGQFVEEAKTFLTLVAIGGTTAFDTI
jgi:hypothetical protein